MVSIYELHRNEHKAKKYKPRYAFMLSIASLSSRFIALLIDFTFIVTPFFLYSIYFLISGTKSNDPLFLVSIIIIGVVSVLLFGGVTFYTKGITPGYLLTGIRLVSAVDGKQLSFKQFIFYNFISSFSLVPIANEINYFTLLTDKNAVSVRMKQAGVIPVRKKIYQMFIKDYGIESLEKESYKKKEYIPGI